MLKALSIKSLYTLALAEGEGVGTAYEYFAKRLVLRPWLAQRFQPRRVLIAGLPQKYGSSLDFLLLAQELGAAVTVVDERESALERLAQSLTAVKSQGWLADVNPIYRHLNDLTEFDGEYDLCLSSEVLQRLTAVSRPLYVQKLRQSSTAVVLFAPNADNPAHTSHSGLTGLHQSELAGLVQSANPASPPHLNASSPQLGYIDMPPFPPGIVRSEEQRAQASSGRLEALAMWGLATYARLEIWLPTAVRRRQSHIVYALVNW